MDAKLGVPLIQHNGGAYRWADPQDLLHENQAKRDYALLMAHDTQRFLLQRPKIDINAPNISSIVPAKVADPYSMLSSTGLFPRTDRAIALGSGVELVAGTLKLATDTLNLAPVEPETDSAADRQAAERWDGHINRWFLDPILRGEYPRDMVELYERRCGRLEWIEDGDLSLIAAPTEFLGVNYYAPMRVRADARRGPLEVVQAPPGPHTTAMGWEVDPDGLHRLLSRVRADYGDLAIAITENGASYDDPPTAANGRVDDPQRTAYLKSHLAALRRAVGDGVRVERYFVWSLLDNFEWEWGYDKRFGIVHVDFETQHRTPKDSALWYRDYIARARNGGLED